MVLTNTPQQRRFALRQSKKKHLAGGSGGGGGRRISWEKPLVSSNPLASPSSRGGNGVEGGESSTSNDVTAEGRNENRGGGGSNSRANSLTQKTTTALGWSDGFASMPEIQMQVLTEVGKLVRAAARKGRDGPHGVQCEGVNVQRTIFLRHKVSSY